MHSIRLSSFCVASRPSQFLKDATVKSGYHMYRRICHSQFAELSPDQSQKSNSNATVFPPNTSWPSLRLMQDRRRNFVRADAL